MKLQNQECGFIGGMVAPMAASLIGRHGKSKISRKYMKKE